MYFHVIQAKNIWPERLKDFVFKLQQLDVNMYSLLDYEPNMTSSPSHVTSHIEATINLIIIIIMTITK